MHDLIRLAPTIKESVNGSELLLLVSRLIGRLVLNVNRTLQTNFIGLLPLFCSGEQSLASTDGQIVFIILNACVQLVSSNGNYSMLTYQFEFLFNFFHLYYFHQQINLYSSPHSHTPILDCIVSTILAFWFPLFIDAQLAPMI